MPKTKSQPVLPVGRGRTGRKWMPDTSATGLSRRSLTKLTSKFNAQNVIDSYMEILEYLPYDLMKSMDKELQKTLLKYLKKLVVRSPRKKSKNSPKVTRKK